VKALALAEVVDEVVDVLEAVVVGVEPTVISESSEVMVVLVAAAADMVEDLADLLPQLTAGVLEALLLLLVMAVHLPTVAATAVMAEEEEVMEIPLEEVVRVGGKGTFAPTLRIAFPFNKFLLTGEFL